MNKQRRILTGTLVLIGLTGEIGDPKPAVAASHYPLWACGGRYGGWGWSRPAGPFTGLIPRLFLERRPLSIGIPPTPMIPMLIRTPILTLT
jgi:hypothetical protein